MIIDVYIKGRIKVDYYGESAGGNAELNRSYRQIVFINKWLEDAEETSAYDDRFLTKEPYYKIPQLQDVYISWKGKNSDVFFTEDFSNVVLNDIVIVKPSVGKEQGQFIASFYGTYKLYKPDPIIEKLPVQSGNSQSQEPIVHTGENTTTETEVVDTGQTNEPWRPDDLLDNFNINRGQWDGWKSRWTEHGTTLAIYLALLLIMLYAGCLSNPIWWIPFLFLLKLTGDVAVRIFLPNVANRQIISVNPVSNGRKLLRWLYFLSLIFLCFFFYYHKLYLFAAIAGVILLLHLFTYNSPLIFLIRRVIQGFALLLFLFAFLRLFDMNTGGQPLPKTTDDNDDSELIPETPDSSAPANVYTVSWNDYQSNRYQGSFSIAKNNFSRSYSNRIKLNPNSLDDVYEKCFKVDKQLLPGLIKMFDSINTVKHLDSKTFAEMVATFIQRIPYVLVHDQSCQTVIRNNPNDQFLQQYHQEGKECLSNCKFGLQAPAEFGYNLKGDCDTRALLAFTILSHYGYNVAILTSEAYGHAILGIGLPYQGLYKSYNGVQYYTWELTAKDWQPGFLAPDVSNMNYWNISIIN